MQRLLSMLLFLSVTLSAGDRCKTYVQEVRRAHYSAFGLDYPYWYGVGQLKQESQCRDVISRDGVGSQGVAQITYRIWQKYLNQHGIYHINNIRNQLTAQALIMANCKEQAYSSHLWVAYQIYNGGPLVNKEIQRARVSTGLREIPHDIAREYCKRKTVTFDNGQTINACDINYDYSIRVYNYGRDYGVINESNKYHYW
jgi:hypothetical protein